MEAAASTSEGLRPWEAADKNCLRAIRDGKEEEERPRPAATATLALSLEYSGSGGGSGSGARPTEGREESYYQRPKLDFSITWWRRRQQAPGLLRPGERGKGKGKEGRKRPPLCRRSPARNRLTGKLPRPRKTFNNAPPVKKALFLPHGPLMGNN